MSSYIIEGGKRLEGTVKISGSKNSSLPIIAATILNAGKTTLYNVPNIQDTQMMFKILETLGAKVEKKNGKIKTFYFFPKRPHNNKYFILTIKTRLQKICFLESIYLIIITTSVDSCHKYSNGCGQPLFR